MQPIIDLPCPAADKLRFVNRQQEGAKGPTTPTHPMRSPAKGYPTPEPCYLEGRGRSPSLLAAAPKRRRCCLARPLTLFLAGLLVLAAVLIGLAVGQFAVPLIRTMVCTTFPLFVISLQHYPFPWTPLCRVPLSRREQQPHPCSCRCAAWLLSLHALMWHMFREIDGGVCSPRWPRRRRC